MNNKDIAKYHNKKYGTKLVADQFINGIMNPEISNSFDKI